MPHKMEILLIDTQHFEVLQTLLRLFGQFGHRMKVFTTEGAYSQLTVALQGYEADISWELQQADESRTQFAVRFTREIKTGRYELVMLTTVADNHLIIADTLRRMPAQRSLLTIHSLNGHFRYTLKASLRALIRFIGKNQLVRRAGAVHVLGEVVAAEYRRIAGRRLSGKKLFVIPGSIYEAGRFRTALLNPGEPIRIVLVGAIDERRRHYDDVFRLLEICREKSVNIRITLLGAIQPEYSTNVVAAVERYRSSYGNLDYVGWEQEVPQDQFDRVIEESHFIWMPFRQAMVIQDGVREYYGRTMNSGNLGDAIRYAKPFFIPQFIGMDPVLLDIAQRYTGVEDVVNVLSTMTPGSYAELERKSRIASGMFTLDELTKKHGSLFRNLDTR